MIHDDFPEKYNLIDQATKESGFDMSSDVQTCRLLRTLAATKPNGQFLELGTGTGLATSWILDGMQGQSHLLSLDNDADFLQIAQKYLNDDARLKLKLSDAGAWIEQNSVKQFDYIFADTWHGKYLMLHETLDMLKKGGIYIMDDMLPKSNWPDGHEEKAQNLLLELKQREDLLLVNQDWSSGIIISVKV